MIETVRGYGYRFESMKLKHRSIRFKVFAAISIIALVFIGILVLLNVFFYQDYYMMMTRRSELRDAYGSICNQLRE